MVPQRFSAYVQNDTRINPVGPAVVPERNISRRNSELYRARLSPCPVFLCPAFYLVAILVILMVSVRCYAH